MRDSMSIIFDPDGGVNFPCTAEVEVLLGGVPVAVFSDGTEQFTDDYCDPVYVYSPRLNPDELEKFCEANMGKYIAFHEKHERQILRCERVPIEIFW